MKTVITTACLVLVFVIVVGASTGGYVVILKNGERIRCSEPLSINGNLAIMTLVTRQVTSLPLDQVDLIATERYNKLGLGANLTIDELDREAALPPTPTPRRTLGSYATLAGIEEQPELATEVDPTPTATPGIQLQLRAYKDPKVTAAFTEILDGKNLYLYRTSAGTLEDHFLVQAVTDTQREVFHAIEVVAEAYIMIRDRRPDLAPAAVELKMVETSGRSAGTFRITTEQAEQLAGGEVEPATFYVENVLF